MTEGHGIRNTVIGTVVGGLILTFILWVSDLFQPLDGAARTVLGAAVEVLDMSVSMPLWLVLLLITLVWSALRGIKALRRKLVCPAEGTPRSLGGLKEFDMKMLGTLWAADGERVYVPTLTEVAEGSRLEVESAMDRLKQRNLVNAHYNSVHGKSWDLTPEARDLLLTQKERD